MNRKILAGIAAGLLTTATLLIVAAGAYRAGERSDRTVEVVGQVVSDGEGTTRTVVVPAGGYGWHDGWHGPGLGFLHLPADRDRADRAVLVPARRMARRMARSAWLPRR